MLQVVILVREACNCRESHFTAIKLLKTDMVLGPSWWIYEQTNMTALQTKKNFVSVQSSIGNNRTKGHYREGAELVYPSMDGPRHGCGAEKDGELCLCAGLSVNLLTGEGGSTGSMIDTLIINKIQEKHPDCIISTFNIMLSPKMSDTVMESYHANLSIQQLL